METELRESAGNAKDKETDEANEREMVAVEVNIEELQVGHKGLERDGTQKDKDEGGGLTGI